MGRRGFAVGVPRDGRTVGPHRKQFVAPDEATMRRGLQAPAAEALDPAIFACLHAGTGSPPPKAMAAARTTWPATEQPARTHARAELTYRKPHPLRGATHVPAYPERPGGQGKRRVCGQTRRCEWRIRSRCPQGTLG